MYEYVEEEGGDGEYVGDVATDIAVVQVPSEYH